METDSIHCMADSPIVSACDSISALGLAAGLLKPYAFISFSVSSSISEASSSASFATGSVITSPAPFWQLSADSSGPSSSLTSDSISVQRQTKAVKATKCIFYPLLKLHTYDSSVEAPE
jgi:hypothetical protein